MEWKPAVGPAKLPDRGLHSAASVAQLGTPYLKRGLPDRQPDDGSRTDGAVVPGQSEGQRFAVGADRLRGVQRQLQDHADRRHRGAVQHAQRRGQRDPPNAYPVSSKEKGEDSRMEPTTQWSDAAR